MDKLAKELSARLPQSIPPEGIAIMQCSFCHGHGKDPFGIMSNVSNCCVCGGSGKIQVQTPVVACAHCGGTGAVKTLTCTTCGGRGYLTLPLLPIVSCPVCKGSGDDVSAPAMDCLNCRGKGFIINHKNQEGEVNS